MIVAAMAKRMKPRQQRAPNIGLKNKKIQYQTSIDKDPHPIELGGLGEFGAGRTTGTNRE